jgi:hypothetical protein
VLDVVDRQRGEFHREVLRPRSAGEKSRTAHGGERCEQRTAETPERGGSERTT